MSRTARRHFRGGLRPSLALRRTSGGRACHVRHRLPCLAGSIGDVFRNRCRFVRGLSVEGSLFGIVLLLYKRQSSCEPYKASAQKSAISPSPVGGVRLQARPSDPDHSNAASHSLHARRIGLPNEVPMFGEGSDEIVRCLFRVRRRTDEAGIRRAAREAPGRIPQASRSWTPSPKDKKGLQCRY